MLTRKSELGDLKPLVTALEKDIIDCSNINKAIQAFANDTKLKGEEFKQVRIILNNYSEVIIKRQNAAKALKEGIVRATSYMNSYMTTEFNELNDADKEEVGEKIDSYEAKISSLENSIAYIYNKTYENENDKITSFKTIGYYRRTISELNEQLPTLRRLYDKLCGLAGADSIAFGFVSSKMELLNSYSNNVKAIEPCVLNIEI